MCYNWSTTHTTFPPLAGNMGNKGSAKITVLLGRSYMVHDVRVSYASANKTETVTAPLANLMLPAHHQPSLVTISGIDTRVGSAVIRSVTRFCLDSLVGRRLATRPLRCRDSGILNLKSVSIRSKRPIFFLTSCHPSTPTHSRLHPVSFGVPWLRISASICH